MLANPGDILQELHLSDFTFSPPPPLIKETGNQTLIRWYWRTPVCHLFRYLDSWIKSLFLLYWFTGLSHGRRSLVGCSPWGLEESDTTKQLHFHFSLSCTGEGNGNPLQCSCLENPRDGVSWWAAVYGVAQSWTRLKWLSSSCMWQADQAWFGDSGDYFMGEERLKVPETPKVQTIKSKQPDWSSRFHSIHPR